MMIIIERKSDRELRNIDQNQLQPINANNKFRTLQGNNIARNEAIPNGEAYIKTDDEKRWLLKTADEKRNKGTRFMLRLKQRWDKQYPEKNRI